MPSTLSYAGSVLVILSDSFILACLNLMTTLCAMVGSKVTEPLLSLRVMLSLSVLHTDFASSVLMALPARRSTILDCYPLLQSCPAEQDRPRGNQCCNLSTR